jgi:hypothetical protein
MTFLINKEKKERMNKDIKYLSTSWLISFKLGLNYLVTMTLPEGGSETSFSLD